MPINFKHYEKKQKLLIPFLIQLTLADSNQNRFPLDFFHTFTVILPSVTRSNFLFPFRSLVYNPSLNNSNHVLRAWQVKKKTVY